MVEEIEFNKEEEFNEEEVAKKVTKMIERHAKVYDRLAEL